MKKAGVINRLVAPTIAVSISPCASAREAASSAKSEEEHAVSMVNDGPCKSKTWLIRLAITASELPVIM